MDFETHIKTILSIIQRANLSDNSKKVAIDSLKHLALNFNVMNEKLEKQELRGRKISGNYDSILDKCLNLLILFGIEELQFNSINDEFLRWMLKNLPEKYSGRLMNYYLIEGLELAWLLCEKLNEGEKTETGYKQPSWTDVRKCFLNADEHIEKSVNQNYEAKIIELIESNQSIKDKEKYYRMFLKK